MYRGVDVMIVNETYTLINGVSIPKVGLGTWMISNEDVVQAVKEAIAMGYRHIDTAQAYLNEEGVGQAIKQSKIAREEIFVTTKLAAEVKTYDEAVQAIEDSLKKMELEYIDLMIIHSPQPWVEYGSDDRYFKGNQEAWRALEDAYKAGKLKAIGVSNFIQEDLNSLLAHCRIKPMVNQILAHISNTPFELIEFCHQHDILVEAYSPVAHGELMKNEAIIQMAKRYGVSVAQLSIQYTLQLDLLPLPKTANPKHMQNNMDLNFEIKEPDMQILKEMERIKDYGSASVMPVFGGKL